MSNCLQNIVGKDFSPVLEAGCLFSSFAMQNFSTSWNPICQSFGLIPVLLESCSEVLACAYTLKYFLYVFVLTVSTFRFDPLGAGSWAG